jgi:hypothetical protein
MPIAPEARLRLARQMDERRRDLRLRWQDVAKAGGISLKTLHSVRTGDAGIAPLTESGIEDGLRWEPGSVAAILDGGSAVPRDDRVPAEPPEGWLTASEVSSARRFADPIFQRLIDLIAAGVKSPSGAEMFSRDPRGVDAQAWDLYAESLSELERVWLIADAKARQAAHGRQSETGLGGSGYREAGSRSGGLRNPRDVTNVQRFALRVPRD